MATRVLFRSDAVTILDYRCEGFDSRKDECADDAEVVFVRSGAFRIESERGRAIADPARAVLLRSGERFRITHPGPCNDRCLVVRLSPTTFGEMAGAVPRPVGQAPFSRLVEACAPEVYMAQRRLGSRLERREDDLAIAEEALEIVASLLAQSWSSPPNPPRDVDHDDERVAAVRALLAHRYAERLSLAEVGTHVGLSPFRIARLFRASTGSTIHGHRVEMRLRAAVDRLADGESDLTGLALDLGFADHAHFTNTFRRRFGMPPSRYRATASGTA
jgi:AraC-like DNA-binding protein